MRRTLNILQACHAAFPTITSSSIYLCTGSPLPSDLTLILDALLNSEFSAAYSTISSLCIGKGYALSDVLNQIWELVEGLDVPPNTRIFFLEKMGEIQARLDSGGTEKLQLSSLIGVFRCGVELASKWAIKYPSSS